MTALLTQPAQHGYEDFIREEVTLISSLNDARIQQMMAYSKAFLDKVFPLTHGSHKDVRSYVVYYQHLLAFFDDGSQSGLKDPKQFVALSGHKEAPSSLVLKNNQGYHVEIIIDANGKRGALDAAHIDDIQVETNAMQFADVHIAANDASQPPQWFSMIRGDSEILTTKDGQRICKCVDQRKSFTDKSGDEYRIG